MGKKYYAVKVGRIPGIYQTWDEAKEQINGYSGAVYKGFTTLHDAEQFILESNQQASDNKKENVTSGDLNNQIEEKIANLSEDELKTFIFLENSCGDGAFIQALMDRGVPANHIYACDIDKDICDAVQKMLPPGHFRLGSFFK